MSAGWDAPRRRIDGVRTSLLDRELVKDAEPIEFQRRIYSIEEISTAFTSVGLGLVDVFDDHDARCAPSDREQELYVEAQKL